MSKPIHIESQEWWYKGCFIQGQDHPELLKYVVFKDTEDQEHVGVCNTFKQAKKLCEDNEVIHFKQGWFTFV